jgi:hypothetical protein
LLGTIPDGARRDGRPAAVSSPENFARFYFPPSEKEPKSNLAKISGESYPFRGWPQKQAGVYTSDINREWFRATEGREKQSWLSGPTPRDVGRASLNG